VAARSAGGEEKVTAGGGGLPDKRVNACPVSVLSAGCTRRSWALRGTYLTVRVGKAGPEMAAGSEVRLGATASNWRTREGRKVGNSQPVMILTPRQSFCGGLRR
jgi:hypothetical protein